MIESPPQKEMIRELVALEPPRGKSTKPIRIEEEHFALA